MSMWRFGIGVLLGTWALAAVGYATQVWPITSGRIVHEYGMLGAGIVLAFLVCGTLALTTAAVAMLALALWRRPILRTPGRRRVLEVAVVLDVGIALYAASVLRA